MDQFEIRLGKAAEVEVVARHRCEMFLEMGTLVPEDYSALLEASKVYFEQAMLDSRYVAWFACAGEKIVGGGGMQINTIPPRPGPGGQILRPGPQGLIINVFVEPDWRKQGIAEALMRKMIRFARMSGLSHVILHASDAGRPLYEKLGFSPTGEMRLFT